MNPCPSARPSEGSKKSSRAATYYYVREGALCARGGVTARPRRKAGAVSAANSTRSGGAGRALSPSEGRLNDEIGNIGSGEA
jgi:hypothetical protein